MDSSRQMQVIRFSFTSPRGELMDGKRELIDESARFF